MAHTEAFLSSLGPSVGRAADSEALRTRVDAQRLVVLTGPVGVGKHHLVACTLEGAVRLVLDDDDDPRAVQAALKESDATILVVDDGPLAALACATWLQGEGRRAVKISTQRSAGDLNLAPLSTGDARALFVALANLDRLDEEDDTAVDGIIARCGGLPLAIEVCAAQVLVARPRELLKHLEDASAELMGDTVGAAIAVALELLPESTREVFVRGAVLEDEVSFACVQAVTGATLKAWHTLSARSLVEVHNDGGARRFSYLAPIRAVVRTDDDDACVASARYFKAAPDERPRAIAKNLLACARALRDRDALVCATDALVSAGPVAAGLKLWDALWPATATPEMYLARGRLRLCHGELSGARADLEQAGDDARVHLATAMRFMGERAEAAALYDVLLEDAPDDVGLLEAAAGNDFERGDTTSARARLSRAQELARDPAVRARLAHHLAVVAQETGDLEGAESAYRAALTAHEALGAARFCAIARFDLGALALEAGRARAAIASLEQARDALDDIGDRRQHLLCRGLLSFAARQLGEDAEELSVVEAEMSALGDAGFSQALARLRGARLEEEDLCDEARLFARLVQHASSALVIEDGGRAWRRDERAGALSSKAAAQILVALARARRRASTPTRSFARGGQSSARRRRRPKIGCRSP